MARAAIFYETIMSLADKQSTISRVLSRLEDSGFLTVSADAVDSRRRNAELRPGVRAFLSSVLEA